MIIKKLFCLTLLFSENIIFIYANQKKDPCTFAKMGGEQPEESCLIRDFLIAMKKNGISDKKMPGNAAYLFSGEPGTGKTMCVEQIAEEAGVTLIQRKLGEIVKNPNSNIVKILQKIYDKADDKVKSEDKPVIILLDDVKTNDSQQDVLRVLNVHLDSHYDNPNVVTIITSNSNITSFEPAFKDRCEHVIWSLPDQEKRFKIIEFYVKLHQATVTEGFMKEWALKSEGFSARNITKTFRRAKRKIEQNQKKWDAMQASGADMSGNPRPVYFDSYYLRPAFEAELKQIQNPTENQIDIKDKEENLITIASQIQANSTSPITSQAISDPSNKPSMQINPTPTIVPQVISVPSNKPSMIKRLGGVLYTTTKIVVVGTVIVVVVIIIII